MSEQAQIPGYIREAGQKASDLAGVAGRYAGGEFEIGDILTKKISEAYAANRDIVEKLDASTQSYFSAPSEARTKFEGVFNPFQRENLVSQYVGNKALPMLSQANILGSRMGGISDLVRSGVAGYQALSARKGAEAQAAADEYSRRLQEFQLEEQLNAVSTQEMEMNGRRVLVTLDRKGNIVKKVDLGPAKGSGAGGSPFGNLTSAISMLQQLGIIPSGQSVVTDQPGGQYWEEVATFDDLNPAQKQEALRMSANSNKSVDEIAREIIEGGGQNQAPQGGVYGATGTPAANVDYSKLTVPEGWRP